MENQYHRERVDASPSNPPESNQPAEKQPAQQPAEIKEEQQYTPPSFSSLSPDSHAEISVVMVDKHSLPQEILAASIVVATPASVVTAQPVLSGEEESKFESSLVTGEPTVAEGVAELEAKEKPCIAETLLRAWKEQEQEEEEEKEEAPPSPLPLSDELHPDSIKMIKKKHPLRAAVSGKETIYEKKTKEVFGLINSQQAANFWNWQVISKIKVLLNEGFVYLDAKNTSGQTLLELAIEAEAKIYDLFPYITNLYVQENKKLLEGAEAEKLEEILLMSALKRRTTSTFEELCNLYPKAAQKEKLLILILKTCDNARFLDLYDKIKLADDAATEKLEKKLSVLAIKKDAITIVNKILYRRFEPCLQIQKEEERYTYPGLPALKADLLFLIFVAIESRKMLIVRNLIDKYKRLETWDIFNSYFIEMLRLASKIPDPSNKTYVFIELFKIHPALQSYTDNEKWKQELNFNTRALQIKSLFQSIIAEAIQKQVTTLENKNINGAWKKVCRFQALELIQLYQPLFKIPDEFNAYFKEVLQLAAETSDSREIFQAIYEEYPNKQTRPQDAAEVAIKSGEKAVIQWLIEQLNLQTFFELAIKGGCASHAIVYLKTQPESVCKETYLLTVDTLQWENDARSELTEQEVLDKLKTLVKLEGEDMVFKVQYRFRQPNGNVVTRMDVFFKVNYNPEKDKYCVIKPVLPFPEAFDRFRPLGDNQKLEIRADNLDANLLYGELKKRQLKEARLENLKAMVLTAMAQNDLSLLQELFDEFKWHPDDIGPLVAHAVAQERTQIARWLVTEKKASSTLKKPLSEREAKHENDAQSPLALAVSTNNIALVRFFVEKCEVSQAEWETLSILAGKQGHKKIIACFIKAGMPFGPALQEIYLKKPKEWQQTLYELLDDPGISDLVWRDRERNSLLYYAYCTGNLRAMQRLLLQEGAKTAREQKNKQEKPFFNLAPQKNKQQMDEIPAFMDAQFDRDPAAVREAITHGRLPIGLQEIQNGVLAVKQKPMREEKGEEEEEKKAQLEAIDEILNDLIATWRIQASDIFSPLVAAPAPPLLPSAPPREQPPLPPLLATLHEPPAAPSAPPLEALPDSSATTTTLQDAHPSAETAEAKTSDAPETLNTSQPSSMDTASISETTEIQASETQLASPSIPNETAWHEAIKVFDQVKRDLERDWGLNNLPRVSAAITEIMGASPIPIDEIVGTTSDTNETAEEGASFTPPDVVPTSDVLATLQKASKLPSACPEGFSIPSVLQPASVVSAGHADKKHDNEDPPPAYEAIASEEHQVERSPKAASTVDTQASTSIAPALPEAKEMRIEQEDGGKPSLAEGITDLASASALILSLREEMTRLREQHAAEIAILRAELQQQHRTEPQAEEKHATSSVAQPLKQKQPAETEGELLDLRMGVREQVESLHQEMDRLTIENENMWHHNQELVRQNTVLTEQLSALTRPRSLRTNQNPASLSTSKASKASLHGSVFREMRRNEGVVVDKTQAPQSSASRQNDSGNDLPPYPD